MLHCFVHGWLAACCCHSPCARRMQSLSCSTLAQCFALVRMTRVVSTHHRKSCYPSRCQKWNPWPFASAWLWNHKNLDEQGGAAIHTIVCGAARPSDLDLPAVAAHLQGSDPDRMLSKTQTVVARLEQAKEDALGKEWLETCFAGILKSNQSKYCVEHNQIRWLYNNIQAFGLWEFAKNRYGSLESNLARNGISVCRMRKTLQRILEDGALFPDFPMRKVWIIRMTLWAFQRKT